MTRNELYGYLHPATREWKEGIISVTFRDMANNKSNKHQWIVLDGDIDAEWIEVMQFAWNIFRLQPFLLRQVTTDGRKTPPFRLLAISWVSTFVEVQSLVILELRIEEIAAS